VLDRLGYGASRLRDGDATCLGAQADMLHQVVQHVRSGNYDFTRRPDQDPAHAGRVVVHGHGVGAAIAQLEAATFDDVDGLVLMSWAGSHATPRTVEAAGRQVLACLGGANFATYGRSPAVWRSLLFRTAPAPVQRSASARRGP